MGEPLSENESLPLGIHSGLSGTGGIGSTGASLERDLSVECVPQELWLITLKGTFKAHHKVHYGFVLHVYLVVL